MVSDTQRNTFQRLPFEKLFDTLPASIFWKNTQGVFLGCNDPFLKILGLTSKTQLIGKTSQEFMDAETAKKISQDDHAVIDRAETITLEIVFNPLDQSSRWLVKKTPIFNESRVVVGLVALCFDVTSITKLHVEERKKAILDEKLDVISTLCATLAHEIRTPLAALKLGLSASSESITTLLGEETSKSHNAHDAEKIFALLKNLERKADEIQGILSHFINNSRSFLPQLSVPQKTNRKHLRYSIVDLIEESISTLTLSDLQKKLIEWSRDDCDDFLITTDRHTLKYVLINLLKNALRSLKEAGKGHLSIQTKYEGDPNNLIGKIIIRDTGLGMNTTDTSHAVFDHFYTTWPMGLGLGLPFCKMAIDELGGTLTCDALKNEFTEFTISLPNVHSSENRKLSSEAHFEWRTFLKNFRIKKLFSIKS